MKSLSVLCAVAAVLASSSVLVAQAQQTVEAPVFFKDVPGAPKSFDDEQAVSGSGLRIYNGGVAGRTQFPYQAALYIDLSVFCGGSLIHEKWVLTAAHCVDGGAIWYVMLGVSESLTPVQDGRKTYVTRGGIQHPDYDASNIINDLGLIQLMRPATLGLYIQTIKLTSPNQYYMGYSATVSGFGRTDDASASPISPQLKYASLLVVENQVCADAYGDVTGLHPSVICLRAEGASSCKGDSGGPLTVTTNDGALVQIGTVSFGASRGCTQGYPVGYGNVAKFIDWISETTGEEF